LRAHSTGEVDEYRITVHPKLQHYGLTTTKLKAMIDWYGKVLGVAY